MIKIAYKEYFSVKDLRDELELYDETMEVAVQFNKELYEFNEDNLDIHYKGEPKLIIKVGD